MKIFLSIQRRNFLSSSNSIDFSSVSFDILFLHFAWQTNRSFVRLVFCCKMTTKLITMVTRSEDLPLEIWLLIFCYLEGHDLFRAFRNLNNDFSRLLRSDYLWHNIQFKKNSFNVHCHSKRIFHRIMSLEWIAKPHYGYLPQFIQKNASNFVRLQALKIEIYPRQMSLICQILPELHSLRNLSIQSEQIQSRLIETVLALPSLDLCELTSSSALSNIECNFHGQSQIEILHLKNISVVIQPMLNSFFDHLPNLRKCQIDGTVKTFKTVSSWLSNEISLLERIPKLTLKCKSNRMTLVFFEQFQSIIPMLKSLALRIYVDIDDEILLERLSNDWWIFVESMNISIATSPRIEQEKFPLLRSKMTRRESAIYQFLAEIHSEE